MSTGKVQITRDHVKAARVLLHMTQEELAKAAGISPTTLAAFEAGTYTTYESTVTKIRETLELRGIEFTNGNNPGVKLYRDKAVIPAL